MFRNPVTDAIIALFVILLIFGPKRVPALARSLGLSMREFKSGITEKSESEADPPALTPAQSPAAPVTGETPIRKTSSDG